MGGAEKALVFLVLVSTLLFLSFPALPRVTERILDRWWAPGPSFRWKRGARFLFSRPGIALLGGILAVGGARVGLERIPDSIDGGTLALLLGMMVLVATLELAGFFDLLSSWVVQTTRTPRSFLVSVALSSGILSALALNDAVVLLFTPVIVRSCRARGLPVSPFLIVEASAANIGSVATPVGNPQNAYIAVVSGLGFLPFLKTLGVVAALSLGVLVLWALLFFRKDLETRLPAREGEILPSPPKDPRFLALSTVALGLTLLGFVAIHPPLGLGGVALLGGTLALGVAALHGTSPRRVLQRVDYGILVLFVGLFLLMEGVRTSGVLEDVLGALSTFGTSSPWGIAWTAAILSNLISNVPAVLLLSSLVERSGDPRLFLTLALSSTLAGNATFLGAAANVITAEVARSLGAHMDPVRFLKFGFPLAVVTIALGLLFV